MCVDAVSFVINVSQLLLQVELDPVVEANHGASSSRLSDEHVFEP